MPPKRNMFTIGIDYNTMEISVAPLPKNPEKGPAMRDFVNVSFSNIYSKFATPQQKRRKRRLWHGT